MTHQGRRRTRRPDSATGEYHVCGRCGVDSETPYEIMQVSKGSCALVRGDWLCTRCWVAHRANCPICRTPKAA